MIKVDEDQIDIDEAPAEEMPNEQETIEKSEVSEESEPAIIQDEEEEEDRVITIGDSVPEAEGEEVEDKETPIWVKKVRKSNRRLESENKSLKRQIEANEKATEIVKPVELGEEPTLATCKYDDVKYKQELRAYDERKRKVETQAAEKVKTVEAQNKEWQDRQEQYVSLKQEHSFKDFAEAEDIVSSTFSQTQQGIIIQGAKDSALLVYALGKNTKKLEELSKITNNIDFAVEIGRLESQLKVTSKKAPAPEKRISTGKAGGITGKGDKVLEQLREEAGKTGNYTKVTAYKKKLKSKG